MAYPVIDCGSLANPVNGQVMVTNTTYNSIATYSCNTGYLEVGGTTSRSCQDDGNWSASAPTCQSKSQAHLLPVIVMVIVYVLSSSGAPGSALA